jgi:hypothetical protein
MVYQRRYLIVLVLAFTAIFMTVSAAAAQSLPDAQWAVGSDNLTVGDPILLTLSVTHAADQHVIFPQLETQWGDFRVYSQSPAETVTNPDGTKTTQQVIDVRLFAPGTFTIPDLSIELSNDQGQLSEVEVTPVSLTIQSVLVEGDRELRDLKPQAELPYFNLTPWIIAGTVGTALLGGIYLWRQRQQASLAGNLSLNRPAHEVALEELERIEKLRLPESGQFKEHYTMVSDCLRGYIEETYHFPVRERTTSEIRAGLKVTSIQPEAGRQLVQLLEESDLVKFSKHSPSLAQAYQVLANARQIVMDTRPIPEMSIENLENGYPAGGTQPQTEVSA